MNSKKPKGFAALSPEKRSEIARKGGLKVQAMGKAHKWTTDTARDAAKKAAEVRRENAEIAKGAENETF